VGNRPSAEIEIEAARPKSRGHPTSNKRETRFAIVFILQDSDGVAFGAGFFQVLDGDDGDNFRCVGDEICREGLGLSRRRGSALGCGFRDLSS
jgi:hypothetical protein